MAQLDNALRVTNGPVGGNLGGLLFTARFAANVALGTIIVRAQFGWAHPDWFDSADAAWAKAIAFLESLGPSDHIYHRVALLSSYFEKASAGTAQAISVVSGKPQAVIQRWLDANGGPPAVFLVSVAVGLAVWGLFWAFLGLAIVVLGAVLAIVAWRRGQ